MQLKKVKYIMLAILALFVFFFSNDFGLIDVEKTSIITAIAVDKSEDDFLLTAQIAVPEATDTNAENLKAQLSGKGKTVGEALKNLGDLSGWFPKLSFCNLILLGNNLADSNVIEVLDYFAKTLRVQDSALVALAENTASELLSLSTPLDNISAFALQKIMLKNTGFDRDVSSCDVKTFCSGHYSISSSAFMPIVKAEPAGPPSKGNDGSSGGNTPEVGGGSSGSSSNQQNQNNLFNAKTTALFKEGKKVGELDEQLTLAFNALFFPFNGTTFAVNDVTFNGEKTDYLLTVTSCRPSLSVVATDNQLNLNIELKLYCKVSDHRANGSNAALSNNQPLPLEVVSKAENIFFEDIMELVQTEKQTGCDFLRVKEKLYRYNHEQYSRYKDNFIEVFKPTVKVSVIGQK